MQSFFLSISLSDIYNNLRNKIDTDRFMVSLRDTDQI